MLPLESYERITSKKGYRFKHFLKGVAMKAKQQGTATHLALFMLGLILGFLLAIPLQARGQQVLDKERGFPLNESIVEAPGTPFCTSEEDAKKLVTIHANEGAEKAGEFFYGEKSQCWQAGVPFSIVYTRLVLSLPLKEGGTLSVYAGFVGNDEVYIITTWTHQKTEV